MTQMKLPPANPGRFNPLIVTRTAERNNTPTSGKLLINFVFSKVLTAFAEASWHSFSKKRSSTPSVGRMQ